MKVFIKYTFLDLNGFFAYLNQNNLHVKFYKHSSKKFIYKIESDSLNFVQKLLEYNSQIEILTNKNLDSEYFFQCNTDIKTQKIEYKNFNKLLTCFYIKCIIFLTITIC